jgi:hypothetical protein
MHGGGKVKHGAVLDQRAPFLLIETGTRGGGVGAAMRRTDSLLRAYRREPNGKRK